MISANDPRRESTASHCMTAPPASSAPYDIAKYALVHAAAPKMRAAAGAGAGGGRRGCCDDEQRLREQEQGQRPGASTCTHVVVSRAGRPTISPWCTATHCIMHCSHMAMVTWRTTLKCTTMGTGLHGTRVRTGTEVPLVVRYSTVMNYPGTVYETSVLRSTVHFLTDRPPRPQSAIYPGAICPPVP